MLPTLGMASKSLPAPSDRSTLESTPPATGLAFNTTAPAPSPNKIQVLRSCQSKMRLMVSAPIISAA